MKKSLVCSVVMIFLLMFWTSAASAYTMEVIGTAQFVGATDPNDPVYNLIWDPVNNGNSVVWLDYSYYPTSFLEQKNARVAGLDSSLTINLLAGYSVTWGSSWRLPSTVDGESVFGYDGTTTAGYNITSSEMGHLFYTELGNKGQFDIYGNERDPLERGITWGLTNTGDFENIYATSYWSGTEYTLNQNYDWVFSMNTGYQSAGLTIAYHSLPVRTGQVSVVPEPTTMLLFGVGLLGVAGVSRRRNQ